MNKHDVKIYCCCCEKVVSVFDCINNGGGIMRSTNKESIVCPVCLLRFGVENVFDNSESILDILIRKSNPELFS